MRACSGPRPTDGTVAQSIVDAAAAVNRERVAEPGSVGVVVGATLSDAPDLSALGGPVLVPGVGAQGGRPDALGGFGGARPGQLLPAVSREVLRAGPDVGRLAGRRGADARRGRLSGMTAYDVCRDAADCANTVRTRVRPRWRPVVRRALAESAEVLKYPGVPARAAVDARAHHRHTATAMFVATPGRDPRVLAGSIAVIGIFGARWRGVASARNGRAPERCT